MIFVPYADDKRNVDVTENVPASQEQVDKMKEIIQKLRFKYRYLEINRVQGVAWGRKHNHSLLCCTCCSAVVFLRSDFDVF